MKVWIINLINEHKELIERISKLFAFISTNKGKVNEINNEYHIDIEDYALLKVKLSHMMSYCSVIEDILNKHGIIIKDKKYFEDVNEYFNIVEDNAFKDILNKYDTVIENKKTF